MRRQWTSAEAWNWYHARPWIRSFNSLPFIAKEIEIIQNFARRADEKFVRTHKK